MTQYVFPRLSHSVAEQRFAEVVETFRRSGISGLEQLSAAVHPSAAPVPTGGHVADPERILWVQSRARESVKSWLDRGSVPASEVSRFDAALGRALHEALEIVPADAAHTETWSFLSLVVLPDITVLRFPDMHRDRIIGSSRNTLRRAWLRYEVLGDLMENQERPLGEDELVGLFERTAVARNRALVRLQAKAVLAYEGSSRSAWARQLYKRVRFATGARMLDLLTSEELAELVQESAPASRARPPRTPSAPDVPSAAELVTEHPASEPKGQYGSSRTRSELERRFHSDMSSLYRRTTSEFGHGAVDFIWMMSDYGAVEAARRLVTAPRPSQSFDYLWARNRLDLTVEALILRLEYRELFDPDVIARARSRLREAGYQVGR